MSKIFIKDMDQYKQKDLAKKYKFTSGTQEKINEKELQGYLDQIKETGYFIVEHFINETYCHKIKDTVLPLFEFESGRNNFEGFKTLFWIDCTRQPKTYIFNPNYGKLGQ